MFSPDDREQLIRFRLLDADGRLARWPTKAPQRRLALRFLFDRFAPDRVYTESEVNEILNQAHAFQDWSLLRRELVDHRFLQRDPAGREYRVTERRPDDCQDT